MVGCGGRRGIRPSTDIRSPTERQPFGGSMSSLGIAAEALLAATVSVPWERPVHAARLAFLGRVAHPSEVSVHVACGTDRLAFIDVAFGLTTIVTDIDIAALEILAQQFADL